MNTKTRDQESGVRGQESAVQAESNTSRRTLQSLLANNRRGIVLLAVLIVVAIMALAGYRYSDLMLSEYRKADNSVRDSMARAFADSGIQSAAALLGNATNFSNVLQNNCWDNPTYFQEIIVQANEHAFQQGRFSLVAPMYDQLGLGTAATAFRFGVLDEASKLNLCTLIKADPSGTTAFNALMLLPNMTEDMADCIIDWIDQDDNPRPSGAEVDSYNALDPAYQPKNNFPDSIEELLLVQNMTPQYLYGSDTNRNGLADTSETGSFDPGLASYLTVWSKELNVSSTGNPRVYVNGKNLQSIYNALKNSLNPDLATFIILYRQYGQGQSGNQGKGQAQGGGQAQGAGQAQGGGQGQGQGGGQAGAQGQGKNTGQGGGSNFSKVQLNFQTPAKTQISTLYDLIGASVTVPAQTTPGQPNQPAATYSSPLTNSTLATLLPALLDQCTTTQGQVGLGKVNVNTANAAVLTCLPGLTEDIVQKIISARPPLTDLPTADPSFATAAWLMTNSTVGLTKAQMQKLDPFITARTTPNVFRVQALGYFDQGSTSARIEAVIDTNNGRPRIVYQRDISELGKAFDLSMGQ
jgi:type II secretory pathway component PulK